MPLDKDKLPDWVQIQPENLTIWTAISSTKRSIDSRLNVLSQAYDLLKDLEKNEKWFHFRQDTMETIWKWN